MTDNKYLKKGTIRLNNLAELDLAHESFKGESAVSPGGAAGMLGVSRAYIHQLEKEKKIRAFRIKEEKLNLSELSGLPFSYKLLLLLSKRQDYIFIPVVDLVEYREGVRKKKKKGHK
jgi:hypothetical protein